MWKFNLHLEKGLWKPILYGLELDEALFFLAKMASGMEEKKLYTPSAGMLAQWQISFEFTIYFGNTSNFQFMKVLYICYPYVF